MRLFVFALLVNFFAFNAHANLPELAHPKAHTTSLLRYTSQESDTYRIGDEWGKNAVSTESLQNASPEFRRAALATAKVGGGTSFYLGKFNGLHVMATNHHVLTSANSCLGSTVTFPMLKVSFKCSKFFGSWSDIDLALFVIDVQNPAQEKLLSEVAANFAFVKDVYEGQPLITIGFGVAGNPGRRLMANQDSDCKVFSATGDYHFMNDPDALNPSDYAAWSFSTGCDVSHGDSGSAMVDRNTGEVMGIIWTGKIPKSSEVQSSTYLQNLLENHGPEIWTELSYAVPAKKMGVFLTDLAAKPNTQSWVRDTLTEMLH